MNNIPTCERPVLSNAPLKDNMANEARDCEDHTHSNSTKTVCVGDKSSPIKLSSSKSTNGNETPACPSPDESPVSPRVVGIQKIYIHNRAHVTFTYNRSRNVIQNGCSRPLKIL